MQVMIDRRTMDRTHTYKSHGRIASRIVKLLRIGPVDGRLPADEEASRRV
jgi:hypothetical protein